MGLRAAEVIIEAENLVEPVIIGSTDDNNNATQQAPKYLSVDFFGHFRESIIKQGQLYLLLF